MLIGSTAVECYLILLSLNKLSLPLVAQKSSQQALALKYLLAFYIYLW